MGISRTHGKKEKACLGRGQALAVHRGARVRQGAGAAIAEFIET